MEKFVLFIFTFLFTFIGRLTFYLISKLKKKKSKEKNGISTELRYLITKFKLQDNLADKKSLAAIISFLDALIISLTLIIVITITDNIFLELILGLFIVIIFIYILYEILGKILVKKGFGKDEL